MRAIKPGLECCNTLQHWLELVHQLYQFLIGMFWRLVRLRPPQCWPMNDPTDFGSSIGDIDSLQICRYSNYPYLSKKLLLNLVNWGKKKVWPRSRPILHPHSDRQTRLDNSFTVGEIWRKWIYGFESTSSRLRAEKDPFNFTNVF